MVSPARPVENRPEEGQGGTPVLALAGFHGPLDHLLTLARAQQIDLSSIPLGALLDQLTAAIRQAPASVLLGQKADWVVMAAWLVQLRARLLLPADATGQHEAAAEAEQLRERLVALEEIQALAAWLARRPQLGHDVFARGRPEFFGVTVEATAAIDVIEFLWASLALFDADPPAATTSVYQPRPSDLHTVPDARRRILHRLGKTPDGVALDQLLPDAGDPKDRDSPRDALRRRSAWSSTFVASLELAREGSVVLEQGDEFGLIRVAPVQNH